MGPMRSLSSESLDNKGHGGFNSAISDEERAPLPEAH
jgi:hypothetical protein